MAGMTLSHPQTPQAVILTKKSLQGRIDGEHAIMSTPCISFTLTLSLSLSLPLLLVLTVLEMGIRVVYVNAHKYNYREERIVC